MILNAQDVIQCGSTVQTIHTEKVRMSKWLLTADWQADIKNLDTCTKVHGQEIMLAKKYDCSGIIDLGDMKDDYNPIEARVLEFQVARWKNIGEQGFDRLTLLGNHDRIGQYDDSRNWLGVFNAMGVQAVNKPTVVVKESVVFACLPYMHSKKHLVKAAAKLWAKTKQYGRQYRKVLLFHCDVQGAMYDTGIESQSGVTPKDLLFEKYAFCFGGHIHKRQWITKNSMYVGNPFCFNWGERNQEKGFLVYDSDKNAMEFIKSLAPNWYDYNYILQNPWVKNVPGMRIQVDVTCKLKDDYYKQIDKKKEEVLKKYPAADVYTKTSFAPEENEAPLIDATVPDIDKIKSYVAAKCPEDLEQKQVVKYLESVLSKVSSASRMRSKDVINFESVKARNVLSFKKLDFSYRKQGVVAVTGVNKDWLKHSNGSGKTNFLSMLSIALEGQTFKEQKTDSWVNENQDGKAYVELTLSNGKTKYTIKRSRKPTALHFTINGRDESEDKALKTQTLIQNTLGFTLDTLKSSVYIDATLPKDFIEGTNAERTKLISRFQNLERFKLARDIVQHSVRNSENALARLEENKADAKAMLVQTKAEMQAAKRDHSESLASLLQMVVDAKKKFKKAQRKLADYNKSHEDSYSGKYNFYAAKESEYAKEIYSVTDEMHKQKRELEKTQRFKWKKCPTCRQLVSSDLRKRMHEKLYGEVTRLRDKFEVLHDKQQAVIKMRDAVRDKLNKRRERIRRFEEIISDCGNDLQSAYSFYKRHKETKEQESNVSKLLRVKLKKAKTALRHSRDAVKTEQQDKAMLMFCADAFSRDGIPLYLNSLACPLLNKVAEEYSEMFTDGEIQIIFRMKDGEFEPVIANAHGSQTIEGQSSGEKAWIGIITALSLRELAPKTNLLVLDEPGFGMDPESAKTFGRKISLLKDKFETILIVSHNENITGALKGKSIVIEKSSKTSQVKNIENL